MIKKTVTYLNFNDEERSETWYFNLSKTELTEMEVSTEGGLSNVLKKIVESENVGDLYGNFKRIVLASVGEKSADGNRFVKNDEIRADFLASPAYDALMQELTTDDKKASEFVKGLMPADMHEALDKAFAASPPVMAVAPTPVAE